MPDPPDLRPDEPDDPSEDAEDRNGGHLADGAEADDPDLPPKGDDPMDGVAPTG